MRFESVKALAFGPLVNAEIQFREGLNLVCGRNEAGKSSWHAALYAALCGRRRGRGRPSEEQKFAERYRPWSVNEWRVSARISLADGRTIDLNQDLEGRVDCQAVHYPVGRDVSGEILNDGSPDGALWLGLDRRSFQAVACVRQAEITTIREEADALQGRLQSAAASVLAKSTAAEAIQRIETFQSERVGSTRASTKPLFKARSKLEDCRKELALAKRAQADYSELEQAVHAQQHRVAQAENTRRRMEADLAELRASKLEAQAARAMQLAAQFPDGEPQDLEDDSLLSEQVATVLRDWDQRPQEPGSVGVDPDILQRQLEALPDPGPGDIEEDVAIRAAEWAVREAWARLDNHRLTRPLEAQATRPKQVSMRLPQLLLPVGAIGIATGMALLAVGMVSIGVLTALVGVGLTGYGLLLRHELNRRSPTLLGRWEAADTQLVEALDQAEASLSARLNTRGVRLEPGEDPSVAYMRYADACALRRQRVELQRQIHALITLNAVGQGLQNVAARARVKGMDNAELASALREWQVQRRERLRALDEARSGWTQYQKVLGGFTLEDLQTEARRRRKISDSLKAELGPSAVDSVATGLASEEDGEAQLANLRDEEREAREHLARLKERLEAHAHDMPDIVASMEELEVAEAELKRLEDLNRILDRTKRFLEMATERAHLAIAPVLQTTLQRWLPTVTQGRYVDAQVDPNTLEVKVCSEAGSWRAAESLSHGTAEQVYLLLRVALAQYLGKPEEPCPLILDDVTAQSDAERTQAILDVLAELSAERQVIFFSQEAEVLEWGLTNPDRCHLIKLDVLEPAR